MTTIRRAIAGALCALGLTAPGATRAGAQAPAADHGSAVLAELVAGLGTSVRVLMIGAHPDDEDTHLLTLLARGRHVESAYLSLTRGEGGQNLIGSELNAALGQIRTEELLAARRIDGAHQFFTRAMDFGYSKSAEETLGRWPREVILEDIVTTIRAFRPHVVISVWSGTTRDGHGHHQAAGVLAREAFLAAADTARFSRRLSRALSPWTPLKFYVGARGDSANATLTMDAGEYNPLLGRTYAEIAGLSRSQHASQGVGSPQPKGSYPVYVRFDTALVATPLPDRALFDGMDTTWARFTSAAVGNATRTALDSVVVALGAVHRLTGYATPSSFTPALAALVRATTAARGTVSCARVSTNCVGVAADLATSLEWLLDRASRALVESAGIVVEATAEREFVAVGDTVPVQIALYNRGLAPVTVTGGVVAAEGERQVIAAPPTAVAAGATLAWGGTVTFSKPSISWWLANYSIADTSAYARPAVGPLPPPAVLGEDRVEATEVMLDLVIAGTPVQARAGAIVRKFTDPARGERRVPIAGVPPVTLLVEREIVYARANVTIDRMLRVYVRASTAVEQKVVVSISVPPGLRTDSAFRIVTVKPHSTTTVFFRVRGTLRPGAHRVVAKATANGKDYASGFAPVTYPHIDPIGYYRPSWFDISAVDVNVPPTLSVAYVRGVGDVGDAALEQLGIQGKTIEPAELPLLDSTRYNALVIGPRAFAANAGVPAFAQWVQAFARRGGTVVVQYGQYEMAEPGILPYPITLERPADRVADEHAQVRVLDSTSRLMRFPNAITDRDFGRWVQERALYMPRTYDPRYHPLFAMHDPDEPDNGGAVLWTPLGKGMYIYTTMSFFRQFGVGHPGAARLFVNLLSAGLPRTPPTP